MNKLFVLALIVFLFFGAPAKANSICQPGHWTVEGTDAIFLAGRTDILVPTADQPWTFLLRHGYPTPEEAQETHPDFQPVSPGDVIWANTPASGGINYFNGFGSVPSDFYGPEGNLPDSNLNAIDGISGYKGKEGALVGVFLDDSIPNTGPAPSTLDFNGSIGTDFSDLSPGLGQIFFIGDGFNSVPKAQRFVAPAGATRLFLGVADGWGFDGVPGYYDDNDGYFCIDLNISIPVNIDIKPGSYPNCFNINGHGVIPVAILGSAEFDVSLIDQGTISFGGLDVRVRGNRGPFCGSEDTNDDGFIDLVCQFVDDPNAWEPGADEATLTGTLLDSDETRFYGTDEICVVP